MFKTIKKFSAAVLFATFIFSPVYSQEFSEDPDYGQELSPEELLELENEQQNEAEKNQILPPELQQNFIIVELVRPHELNPQITNYSSDSQILNGLYEGLFTTSPISLEPQFAIAKDFKISRDKKRWTFTIRDNAKTSDGSKITAQTVVDSWIHLQKTPDAPYSSLLDCIKGIKDYRENKISEEEIGLKANGQKLTVILNSPTAHLPRILCHHAFSVFTGNLEVFSGAYVLKEQDKNQLVLEKNKNYWDEQNVALEQVIIKISDDKKENSWLFNTGRTDWITTSFDTNSLINKNAIKISAIFGTTYLFFTCKNPVWNKAEFRNALLTAVPWDKLRSDNLIQASTLVYPLSGYPEVEGLTDYNEDEALELMEEARKNSGIGQDEKLEITFGIADNEYMKSLATILKEAWNPLGVELVTFKISDEQYLSSIPYLNYDIFSYSWIGDFADPLAFLELFREGSTLNHTKWTNEKFTEKLKLAGEETDESMRYKILGQAEQILLDDGMVMPISHSISLHAINLNEIGGWYTNALDIHPLKNIYFKETVYAVPDNVAIAK